MRKVQIVYYLSYGGGFLEHPHLLEVSISAFSTGLCLKDVKKSLANLRGSVMLSSFSWSYKRSYKHAYVWQDLESDNDLIFPTHGGSEYILKGCKMDSSCILQTSACPAPESPSSAFLQSANKISTPVDPLMVKMIEPPSESEKAKKNTAERCSSASLHVCEPNLVVSPWIMEGLEHLHVSHKSDLCYRVSAESPSLNHIKHAFEETKFSGRKCVSQEAFIDIKLPVKGKTAPHGSNSGNCAKDDTYAGASFSSRQHFVDAATQTIEDEEVSIQHTKSKLACPSKCFTLSHRKPFCPAVQGASSLTITSREEMLYKPNSISQNSSREEISRPPFMSSSATKICKLHSTANRKSVLNHKNASPQPKISFHQVAHYSKDQMFQKAMNGLAHGNSNDENPLPSLITSCNSEDWEEESYTNPIDYSFQKSKPTSESTNMKPHHEISIFSRSGRFLRLVSCGGGLQDIRHNGISSNMRNRDQANGCEESMSGAEIPFDNVKYGSLCMHTSLPKAKNNAVALCSSPPYVAKDVLSRGYLSEVELSTQVSSQKVKSNNNKLWHSKGWGNSPNKTMKRASKAVPLLAL